MKRPWLAPLVPLYRAGLGWRNLRLNLGWESVQRLEWPVISVGNLSTGGAGKTPFAIALARLLTDKGFSVDFLSRGYGRLSKEPARVHPDGTADEFGDEPLLIARETNLPVYVAPKRYEAGLLAEAEAAEQQDDRRSRMTRAHILDDGFQHRQLLRDVDILLLNFGDWRDTLFPAGNLREARDAALRAHVLAIPAEEREFEARLRRWGWSGPVWRLHRRMDVPDIEGAVAAFCGIARSEQFFNGLEHAGLQISVRTAFRDHHCYKSSDMQRLIATALSAHAAALVTTEKDAVRLGLLASGFPPSLPLKTARLQIEIENENEAVAWLVDRLGLRSKDPPL